MLWILNLCKTDFYVDKLNLIYRELSEEKNAIKIQYKNKTS